MCKYGVITVASNDCSANPTHVWYKYTYILCNDEGQTCRQRCADARQDESQTDPAADNNYAVGSRRLGPCYTCVNLAIAGKAREEALAEAEEIKRKAEEAYIIAADQAYMEVTEVRPVQDTERGNGRRENRSSSDRHRGSRSGRERSHGHGHHDDKYAHEKRDRKH